MIHMLHIPEMFAQQGMQNQPLTDGVLSSMEVVLAY